LPFPFWNTSTLRWDLKPYSAVCWSLLLLLWFRWFVLFLEKASKS
jgi:hypothetical protein